jgi:flagellin
MAFSIQTNVNSLIAQENLRVNGEFQSRTIQRLTSGYRINQSGDDAAGLAIANQFRSDISELSQGVRNANDGVSQLQIIDGGMNNTAKMLDRLKTLATQSASDTFTGNRELLNSEFQSLLTEIDRQAQGIGLDSGGAFARTLSVYIGGGKAAGTGAVDTANGSVSVNLSSSTTDSKSLGLKGMQAVGATGSDIGTGSSSSVAVIKLNGGNTTGTTGYTDFYFAGPGFADGSKVKVSVNLQSATDVDSLATAINSGIQAAGLGGTQAATAFKNANIVASVHTDATGKKQLAFASSTSAFQVEAGDRMANAFLGNVDSAGLGTAISNTVTGAATAASATAFVPTGVTVRITGAGMTSPVDLTFDSGSTTATLAIADLTAKVAANSALQAAGITVSFGGTSTDPLVFSNARGEKFSVMATGDTANVLGLGSFVAGAGSAVDYTTVTGAAYVNTGATGAYGTAGLQFSLNGEASSANTVSLNLDAGDAIAATKTGNALACTAAALSLTFSIDGAAAVTVTLVSGDTTAAIAAKINGTALINVTASVEATTGNLVITSNTKGSHSLAVAGTAAIHLGLTAPLAYGTSRSQTDVISELNAGFASNSTLQKAGLRASDGGGGTITIASSNNTYFRLNAAGTAATAAIGFGVAGAAFASSLTAAAANNAVVNSAGATNLTALAFAGLKYGNDDQAITVSANDSNGVLQSQTITLQNDGAAVRNGRSIDEVLNYINAQLQQSNNPTLQKIVAVKDVVGGAEKINFLSALNSFNVSVGTSINGDGIGSGTASSNAAALLGTGGTVNIDTELGAKSAVVALASAIATLGTAQAAVGKGQNQLQYAISLAQSQLSNYSAAESRIRDADVAQEAANLTKAQVLQQASIAAMAQANSAPQAVLALLRT